MDELIFKNKLLEEIDKRDVGNKTLVYQTKLESYVELFTEELNSLNAFLGEFDKYDLQIQEYIDSLNAISKYATSIGDTSKGMVQYFGSIAESKKFKVSIKLNEIRKIDKADQTIMQYLKTYGEQLKVLVGLYDELENYLGGDSIAGEVEFYNETIKKIIVILSSISSVADHFSTELDVILNTKGKPRGRGYKPGVDDENNSEEIDDDEEEE